MQSDEKLPKFALEVCVKQASDLSLALALVVSGWLMGLPCAAKGVT